MNIDDLLSPYRGFKPTGDVLVAAGGAAAVIAHPRCAALRATRIDRGPELPSPESWEMFEFVQALTA
ncbi:MAG TPA: hypothetical protein VLI04_06280 [Nocardioidaceae bacterium]|nr:hypothetical protein [Nocardioidaceae bacterium]